MNNILVFCSNSTVALQIYAYHKTKQKKNFYLFIVENNFQTKKVLKILKNFKHKEIHIIRSIYRPIFFSLRNWNRFRQIISKNLKIKNYLINFLKKRKINKYNFEEVWFTNDNFSKVYLNKQDIKKVYFCHALSEVLIFQNKNSFLNFIIHNLHSLINNTFFNIFKTNAYNVKIVSIFNNFLKINKSNKINTRIFKKSFEDCYFCNINKNLKKKKIELINITIPNKNSGYTSKIINNYINFFINDICREIISNKKNIYIFKFKDLVPKNTRVSIINKIKNKYLLYNIILFNENLVGTDSLECFAKNYNVVNYYSHFTSSFYLFKILNKNIKFFDFSNRIQRYWEKEKSNLKYMHQQNNLNLKKTIILYKKIWKVL